MTSHALPYHGEPRRRQNSSCRRPASRPVHRRQHKPSRSGPILYIRCVCYHGGTRPPVRDTRWPASYLTCRMQPFFSSLKPTFIRSPIALVSYQEVLNRLQPLRVSEALSFARLYGERPLYCDWRRV
ncbi:hypothetical protein B0H10DRAFT_2029020 [Mycena sp. CBHHK59/15]|nr:hypothetical protein B0H10DRAFT_2029020 [Mycena sp. CBHHK59/15]